MKKKLFILFVVFLIACKVTYKYDCPEKTFAMAFVGDPQKIDTVKQRYDQMNQVKIYQQNRKLNTINDSLQIVKDKFDEIEKIIQQRQEQKPK